ncbi:MAG: hypothetical protein JWM41_2858 [Gemmatimonadetes bacterium]|nr:hypothetical protein [Gemmatimonadota bacterium]
MTGTITGLTPTDYDPDEYAATCAAFLAEHPDYRVLKRFTPRDFYTPVTPIADEAPLKTALFVDVETTGLDTDKERVIELAMVPFEFDTAGNIYGVGAGESWFSDPGISIPPAITELTGITDEMVQRKAIDGTRVRQLLAGASLVVAHHADFDRRMLERVDAQFAAISWGCSYREVEWERFGCTSKKLEHILASTCREFYSAHRALDDCYVGVHLLAAATLDGRTAFSYLLDSVRQPTARVYAMGAPFSAKDALKLRGYKWSDGTGGKRKAWYLDVKLALNDEARWLHTIGVDMPEVVKLTARDRFSVRADV